MSSLFAEAFLVAPVAPSGPRPEVHYDEILQMNVTADGRPLVGLPDARGPETLTEVRGEAEDVDERHEDDILAFGTTVTKVQVERDDFAAELVVGGTTHTAVDAEPDDEDRVARADLDTFALLAASTDTRVKNEQDDFWTDRDEFPLVMGLPPA
jgi:putative ATP-grasp target RiPP